MLGGCVSILDSMMILILELKGLKLFVFGVLDCEANIR